MDGTIQNFIGGEQRPARSGATLDVLEPAVGQPWTQVAASGSDDVDDAVRAAEAAYPAWSRRPAVERARFLSALADAVEGNSRELAALESRDTGKPLTLAARLDVPRAVANLRFFAAAATQFASESHAMEDGAINYTLRQPLGVVGCISPWNLPLYLLTWKIAPALAAGNTVVAKPSEVTPASAGRLGELCAAAGLPPGVLNLVHGRGPEAGASLVAHPALRAVSFTGSTATGRAIARATADRFTKLSLEMGGKNPAIVFADADLDAAVDGVVQGAFSNQGQICLCTSRVLVERSVYEVFRQRLLERTADLTVGDPRDPATDQGALVSGPHFDKVLACIERARAEGGRVLCGGEALTLPGRCAEGWFVAPTWIEGLGSGSDTNQQEIFGPVATLQPFDDEAQALALANDSAYGLAAAVWSGDGSRCHRLAAQLETGIVWVNCWMRRDLRTPFGGMKASGLGREGGWEALRFFTEPRNVCIDYGQP